MGLFKKKSDPISDRAKALNAEIAALEAKIKELAERPPAEAPMPKVRSTARPQGPVPAAPPPEPVFEEVNHQRMNATAETEDPAAHYNELGVRKYDLAAAWRRFISHFHGPAANNPKLVNYLAAGSIQGLRPLRYEKRVARNRFLALTVILLLILWGLLYFFSKSR